MALEHLRLPHKGFRFWTTAGDDPDSDVRVSTGEVAYKIVEYTDSPETAIALCEAIDRRNLATARELSEFCKEMKERLMRF
ncbi:hypothetical protein E6Q11_05160 [Candidatus Dojkabacteria bacterium]|uniref:Uncharacterized protein n=1 Tax=Candidatus Dojkabacteria bacterium TaxID=2099670 RepID=A0A5C7J3T1_9BACT|nr:MAG: hypothetical protein E6Q11_05160 [Candidatus Dojkabacteria bacterium]